MRLFNPFQNLSFLETMHSNWEAKVFTDVFKDSSGGNTKIQKSDLLDIGSLAVVDQGKSLVTGYTNVLDAKCKIENETIIFSEGKVRELNDRLVI